MLHSALESCLWCESERDNLVLVKGWEKKKKERATRRRKKGRNQSVGHTGRGGARRGGKGDEGGDGEVGGKTASSM